MNVDPFHLNRPVHLARRDVFYEQAKQLIQELPTHKDLEDQHETVLKALALFQDALHHANAANQSNETTDKDLRFSYFLDACVDNTQSITRMLRRQRSVNSKDSNLTTFLGSEDTSAKMATHYRRCAAHILKGTLHLLSHAEAPYHHLQQLTFDAMTSDERARYEKARKHLLTAEQN
ncbi:hypothetical protein [Tichowtungia aerotolerans]|uniref:Uncharacterized protein n=1 Tax=Tichowtungia aerotolerans TaxID=2697043 RepID=A0A6P1M451_9BACT|nr:hypothetical protein [Tichowtungia aerotolerans]QHI68621.1 hypothetical protein GT409_03875 [Tichowtungia aerotolerans]